MRLVVFKKGGESGEVAINPALVTHVRSMSGPYTDIYFKDHRVAVEASFDQVTAKLAEAERPAESSGVPRSWIKTGS